MFSGSITQLLHTAVTTLSATALIIAPSPRDSHTIAASHAMSNSTTTTTISTSTCPTRSASTPHCGTRGELAEPALLAVHTDINKVRVCRDACSRHPSCKSFGHTHRTGPCELYTSPLKHQKLAKVAGAQKVLYDMHCFDSISSISPALTTSKSRPAIASTRAGMRL